MVHETYYSTCRSASLANDITLVHSLLHGSTHTGDTGYIANAGIACRGEFIDIVSCVQTVLYQGISVGSRNYARCTGRPGCQIPCIDTVQDLHPFG